MRYHIPTQHTFAIAEGSLARHGISRPPAPDAPYFVITSVSFYYGDTSEYLTGHIG